MYVNEYTYIFATTSPYTAIVIFLIWIYNRYINKRPYDRICYKEGNIRILVYLSKISMYVNEYTYIFILQHPHIQLS
jgi:hypothetical protein